jgi:hypothetical protein
VTERYRVVFKLDAGGERTYHVRAAGAPSAVLRARGELARDVPAEAYTATVVKVTPAPETGEQ